MLREQGPWAPGLETELKQTRASFLLFGGELGKRPKKGQNIQHPNFNFLRFQPWEDIRACGAKVLSCLYLDNRKQVLKRNVSLI